MKEQFPNEKTGKIRMVTSGSLFDGHDVAINVMRRLFQKKGVEVVHLGHNRSVAEIVKTAIEEDVHAIAISSYQGGHMEFFKYTIDLLKTQKAAHIKVIGGGGGTILPSEIQELEAYGVEKIYSPEDGQHLGLEGMIEDAIRRCSYSLVNVGIPKDSGQISFQNRTHFARLITMLENGEDELCIRLKQFLNEKKDEFPPVIGFTGTGGAGKSSIVDEFILRFHRDQPLINIGIISVDPSKRKSGGALLGDRIRMNAIHSEHIFMRSMATRRANISISDRVEDVLSLFKVAGFDLIILETAGIGQADSQIVDLVDLSTYIMTPEFGAATQLEKIDMLDFADIVAINKADKKGAKDALRAVQKQIQRNRDAWTKKLSEMPVVLTTASHFNDEGCTTFYYLILDQLKQSIHIDFPAGDTNYHAAKAQIIIPPERSNYLLEIVNCIRDYNQNVEKEAGNASALYCLEEGKKLIGTISTEINHFDNLQKRFAITADSKQLLTGYDRLKSSYQRAVITYQVRGKDIKVESSTNSLSNLNIPKIAFPRYRDWGDLLRWLYQENIPGYFPFTSGVFPFKRKKEDPTRMFAGEGGPERTNRRFHYLSRDSEAIRLSTAFDSVTLYGEDPDNRPDIYGKVGNSGVSICTIDDAKKLYSGFDLSHPATSVSMTINGPAATIAAFLLNAAIDQQCEKYIKSNQLEDQIEKALAQKYDFNNIPRPYFAGDLPPNNNQLGLHLLGLTGDQILDDATYQKIKVSTLQKVRGTVQADILKEDQAQNTCIFSTDFSLKVMGDMQTYFVENHIRNFYSVSISGYHIAEAGANPISQLAFTLANGFTYVEYYLSRGLHIDDFAPNLSFFFSNGLDPEYAVIGRVARRIWAKTMKHKYHANERSQKLKYHIQTSGRSLHAQEISFNDIRTTLQALYAIYDNCNSLHTNAYDEAITTPTEESVRRAVAIQLIINRELGLTKNENPLQGSFIIEELTDLVEEAVLLEFERIDARGGVLGAMENMYQRNKIQEESMLYEHLKHSGELPIVGVNTFVSEEKQSIPKSDVIRATEIEKNQQIEQLQLFQKAHQDQATAQLKKLKQVAINGGNIFAQLMETVKYSSLGQISQALYDVGGQYRRNM